MGDSDGRRDSIKSDILSTVADILEISPKDVTSDLAIIDDLPFDSLKLYELVISVEEKYGIRLPDEVLDEIRTIDDLVDVVVGLSNKE